MKIVVVGPGAMGCLIAASLAHRTKEEVALLDRDEARARTLHAKGLIVEEQGSTFKEQVRSTSDASSIGESDLVIVTTKAYATEDACRAVKPCVGERTLVLTVQNGIGNLQILVDHFGDERVLGGVTSHGSTLSAPGHVRHAGKGETVIGRPDGRMSGLMKTVQTVLGRAGFETRISRDIEGAIWSKLIINVGVNALAALTRVSNGALVEHEWSKELMRSAVTEAFRVAKRKRIKLLYDDPIQKCESVCRSTASNICSMLQDVLSKKRTEIDFINGAIARQGKSMGIPTPVNDVFTALVRTIEAAYDATLCAKERACSS